jgi:hypothetical protein
MRPHTYDRQHNLSVGAAFRDLVTDLIRECGRDDQKYVDEGVGEHVNAVAGAAYDLGVREACTPSQN